MAGILPQFQAHVGRIPQDTGQVRVSHTLLLFQDGPALLRLYWDAGSGGPFIEMGPGVAFLALPPPVLRTRAFSR